MNSNEIEDLITSTPQPKPSNMANLQHQKMTSLLLQPLQWLKKMSFASHPTLIIGIIVYGLNLGFIESYFRVVTDYYWKDIQRINPSSAQFYVGLYFIPWMLRPLWGLLSDVFPVMGYHRRPYFIAAGVIGALSAVLVTVITTLPASSALVCFVGVVTGMAIATATIDACIAKQSIEVKELAAELQSLRGVCLSFGDLFGFSISGFVIHLLGTQVCSVLFTPLLCSSSQDNASV